MKYNASQIADMLGLSAPAYPDNEIGVLLTDSRALTYPEESLFFALKTSTNDGHRYISGLIDGGVKNFVVETLPADAPEGVNFFVVPDVEQALRKLSAAHREKFSIPVIGITGSRGKTVVKEWLNYGLSPEFKIARSPRSFNSQIGVPLSVWEIDGATQLGIFEAGISTVGEMSELQKVIKPTVGILTNIGSAHDDGFSDRREKCREKLRLFSEVETLIYCADDTEVNEEVKKLGVKNLLGWSINGAPGSIGVAVESLEAGTKVTVNFSSGPVEAVLPFKDDASIENALHVIVAMNYFNIPASEIAKRVSHLHKVDTRLDVIEGVRDCMVINDSFTNDYDSLAVALDFMKRRQTPDRALTVILGDLECVDKEEKSVYAEIVKLMNSKGVSRLLGIGKNVSSYTAGFSGESCFFPSVKEFLGKISQQDFSNELILVKGAPVMDFHFITDMLEARQHETVLEVNLDAIVHNFNEYKSRLRPSTGIVAMVKAFGYGAGSYELAKTLQSQGAAYLAVAVADEGADLRRAGITMPILVLNPRVDSYPMMFENKLEPEIYSFDLLEQFILEGRRRGIRNYPVHIKLDTGMHRLGFLEKDIPDLVKLLKESDAVSPKSVFSHLAAVDDPAMDDYTMEQFSIFKKCSDMLQSGFSHHIMRHILNSTGITRFPEYQYDMARLGICLYGIATMNDHSQDFLQPVSSLRTAIISIKDWKAGTTIGYNRRGVLARDSRIATIPIGYADGMNRHFGNGRSVVFINGHRCPTVGNICMDACMIDVTDVKCEVGDLVEVFGLNIPVTELAGILDTIPYEVLTSVSTRVKRVYYRE